MTATDPGTIFVSYSHVDRQWVLNLVRDLQAAGLKVWLDAQMLQPGAEWDIEIQHSLERMSVLMAVLSPDSVASRNVLDEIGYALNRNRLVVPVLFRPCEVPYRVARLQYVDFTGNDAMAPVRLIQYLKAAVEAGDRDRASAPRVPPAAVRSEAARAGLPLRALLMMALPTAILLGLAGVANMWHTETAVTLEVVAERTSFVLGGDSAANLLNRSPEFAELRVEDCASMTFQAVELSADPRVPELERTVTGTAPPAARLAFACDAPHGTITLRGRTEQLATLGVLDNVNVEPGATVVLDVAGPPPALTVDVSKASRLSLPVHVPFRIVTDQVDVTQPPLPDPVRRSLRTNLYAYQVRLPPSNALVEIRTASRTVLIVTPPPGASREFFNPNSTLPIASIQFLKDPLDGGPAQTAVRRGKLAYAGLPAPAREIEFAADFLVLDRTSDFHITRLALEDDGLTLGLEGTIVKGSLLPGRRAGTSSSRPVDLRLTALQTVWDGPAWMRTLIVTLWLASTAAVWAVVTKRPRSRPVAPASQVPIG